MISLFNCLISESSQLNKLTIPFIVSLLIPIATSWSNCIKLPFCDYIGGLFSSVVSGWQYDKYNTLFVSLGVDLFDADICFRHCFTRPTSAVPILMNVPRHGTHTTYVPYLFFHLSYVFAITKLSLEVNRYSRFQRKTRTSPSNKCLDKVIKATNFYILSRRLSHTQ